MSDREHQVGQAFVALADSLVDDYDVVDLLDQLAARCVSLLAAESAGILLGDARGQLRVVASTCSTALPARCPSRTSPSRKPWPTWPRLRSCPNAPSATVKTSTTDVAFEQLRGYSRRNNVRLGEVAGQVIAGEITADDLADSTSDSRTRSLGTRR